MWNIATALPFLSDWPVLPLSGSELLLVWLGIAAAYVIFGIAGFGTALIASPLLVQFMPLAWIVPLLALLDFAAAVSNLRRDGKAADLGELRRLLPLMLIGSGIGAAILLHSRADSLYLALGLFVTGYAAYSLGGSKRERHFGPRSAIPFGLVGGVFSAMFGSGGFIYAIYLSGRLPGKDAIRVTQSTLIGCSTLTRAILFLLAGVYANGQLLLCALLLAPAMLAGLAIGRHITLRLSREEFLRVINGLVLVSGLLIIGHYWRLW